MSFITNFENSPGIVAVKDTLRELFTSMLDVITGSFSAFYDWLKNVPLPVPPTMLKLFSNNKANFILFSAFTVYVLYINIRTFVMFVTDKKHSIKKRERIPESKLIRHIWLGGAPGAALAMVFYHHKTHHKNFTVTVIILLAVQLIIYSFVLGFLGFWTFF